MCHPDQVVGQMLHLLEHCASGHRDCNSTDWLLSNTAKWTGPLVPVLTGEVVVDVGKRKKHLRLLLCNLWKATGLSCMLPLWLLLSAAVLLCQTAFPNPLPRSTLCSVVL